VPGNLCNSYRIKPRGRQLIRGWRKGGGGWCNHKATDTHRYPPTYIHIFLHGFDNRIRIRFIVRVPWPYQLHSARQRLAFSPLLPLFFIYLFFFSVFWYENHKITLSWGCCRWYWPKAESRKPNPNLNLSPTLVMLIFNLRLQPNRKLIV